VKPKVTDYFTLTIRCYHNGRHFGYRKLGKGRLSLDIGRWAIVLEFWGMRGLNVY